MSLVSTYVRADDGKMYQNPVLSGDGWFICFDDDDPVELVVKNSLGVKDPTQFLSELGIPSKQMERAQKGASRIFQKKFEEATSWFFEITKRIPHKLITSYDKIIERDNIFQGVIYDPKN